MIDFESKESYDLADLRKIVKVLRGEGGCPWDGEQTHESLRRALLEESYEVCEAIDEGSTEHLKEELGDVLLQVVFHADIEEDAGRFDLDDVADGIVKKLILRHPHVFGDVHVSGTGEVLENWEEIKRREKRQVTAASSLEAVAKSLPALWRAEKIQDKASKYAPFSASPDAIFNIVSEDVTGLHSAEEGDYASEELGDLLFSAVAAARLIGADPEDALNAACDRFIHRFGFAEKLVLGSGRRLEDISPEEFDELWKPYNSSSQDI